MAAQVLYTTLPGSNSFRILELQHGAPSDPLRGTLFQAATLDNPYTYEALSYRWSEVDLSNPSSIEIDGIPLFIGPELHTALLQFRRRELPRHLWIDQICINQADLVEKIHQLEIMGNIYSRAQTVLIWLGDASDHDQSDVAMEFFPTFVEQVRDLDEKSRLQESTEPPSDIIEWRGTHAKLLHKLFSRSWFGRVWTLQEAALGKRAEVWCGQKVFSYQNLETFERGCHNDTYGHWGSALSMISSGSGVSADPENPPRSLIAHLHIISTLREGSSVSSAGILNLLRSLDCSKHQDRVFSVLRFLPPKLVKEIAQKRITSPCPLYHLVAMNGLQRGELEYLGAAGLSQHRISYTETREDSRPRLSLPSWVPDWTYTIRTHSYWVLSSDCLQKRGRRLYTAGGSQSVSPSWSFSDNAQVFSIKGVIIGEVKECAAPFHVPRLPDKLDDSRSNVSTVMNSIKHYQSYIASCTELASKCSSYYGSTEVERACRHSLVGSMMPDGFTTTETGVLVRASDEAVNALFEEFEMQAWFLQRMECNEPWTADDCARMMRSTAAAQNIGSFSKRNNLIQAIAEACKGRRFFISSTCYMGAAPDITQSTDKICVVPSCCAPLVIRPKGNRYQLIGECYVAGVMDGEVMEKPDSILRTIEFE